MHHIVLDSWSQGSSVLHARDPRAKTIVVVGFLVVVATTTIIVPAAAAYLGIVLAGAILARLPLLGLLTRACVVLPFSGTFALMSFMSGDPQRAIDVVLKSYVSAAGVVLLVATTPLPSLAAGLQRLGAPGAVVFVIQLVYRYFFVISEQLQHMLQAARCRGGRSLKRLEYRAATGTVTVLFGKSYERAESVHRAMLARGFRQKPALLQRLAFNAGDAVFFLASAALIAAVRLAWTRPS